MTKKNLKQRIERRGFLGNLVTGAVALGLVAISSPLKLKAEEQKSIPTNTPQSKNHADAWFNQIKGSHRVVYDATRPHEILPFAWPRVFLLTNAATGTPESDCGVVVVLRHDAIPYAFKDKMWEKYNFADVFKAGEIGPTFQAADAATAAKSRNPFWNAKPDDFKVPGIGAVPISINDLQKSGVLFCVCETAITVYSAAIANSKGMKPEEVRNEWMANLIPGIQPVPSGVWALGRAQEHDCKYIFAG